MVFYFHFFFFFLTKIFFFFFWQKGCIKVICIQPNLLFRVKLFMMVVFFIYAVWSLITFLLGIRWLFLLEETLGLYLCSYFMCYEFEFTLICDTIPWISWPTVYLILTLRCQGSSHVHRPMKAGCSMHWQLRPAS